MKNNVAAAIAFSGAILGFTFPLMASIYFTHSVVEMVKWGFITCFVQVSVFFFMRKYAVKIEDGMVAPAVLLCVLSISIGLLNAVCISW